MGHGHNSYVNIAHYEKRSLLGPIARRSRGGVSQMVEYIQCYTVLGCQFLKFSITLSTANDQTAVRISVGWMRFI